MENTFVTKLNAHLNQWVKNNQSISWSLTGGNFLTVDMEGKVIVDLRLFSDGYQQKHILSTPGNYCNSFLIVIQPQLSQFLIDNEIEDYSFTFKFYLNGTTTKEFYVKGLKRVEVN
ncbi:hypothetical protein [Pedobacter sp. L105]|uniref:hypothetical protein n=1 Tax=Pedobacter sp. L105 TaxID=1641871 RepID=UPI00131D7D81|nr:hypothetical protein [Pedobacter sp. L105]